MEVLRERERESEWERDSPGRSPKLQYRKGGSRAILGPPPFTTTTVGTTGTDERGPSTTLSLSQQRGLGRKNKEQEEEEEAFLFNSKI